MNFEEYKTKKKLDPPTIYTLQYIKSLADQTGTEEMVLWDLDEVFKNSDTKSLVTEQTEINKRFFNKLKEKKKIDSVSVDIDKELEVRINDSQKLYEKAKKTDIQKQIDSGLANIRNYVQAIEGYQQNLSKLYDQERGLFYDFKNELQKILNIGFFKLLEVVTQSNGHPLLRFSTMPVDMTFKDINDKTVHMAMGQYMIEFYPINSQVLVKMFKDNVICSGYFHPYINSNGGICWGSGSEAASKALAQSRFCDLFVLLASILTTYAQGDSTPYIRLEAFYEKGTLQNGTAPWRKPDEKKKT